MTIDSVFKDLKARKFAPVYVFHGEEPYFTEQLVKYMEEQILTADEREFNQNVLYGADVTAEDVVVAARRFPMMAEYQVTILKEAQAMKKTSGWSVFEGLIAYLENPNPNTILVLFFRGEKIPKRATAGEADEGKKEEKKAEAKSGKKKKSFYDACAAHVMVESERLKDDKIPAWATGYFEKRGFRIQGRAAMLLAESLGNELDKVVNEADKLMLNQAQGYEFTERDVSESVGVSKDYTLFELQDAIAARNILKANRIANYMGNNSKNLPIFMVLGGLNTYFAKILMLHWLKSSGKGAHLASEMGLPPFVVKQMEQTARTYSPAKIIKIVHHIRETDMKSKGWGYPTQDAGSLMKELLFKIMH